jgi:MarR family transcriptional regulator, lower aerobic nicotinate degradation pathway regulator
MYEIETSLGFLLAKVYQRAFSIFKQELATYDLTPPQLGILRFLWQEDGMTQIELSEKCQVDRTTLGGLIDRLERNGLVERKRHPNDRRAHQIKLTAKGKDLEKPLILCSQSALEKLTTGLNQQELAELTRMLVILRGEVKIYENPSY